MLENENTELKDELKINEKINKKLADENIELEENCNN